VRELAGDGVARDALAPPAAAPVVRFDDPARQHGPVELEALPEHLQAERVQTSERGQIRGGEGSVRHVEVFPVGSVRTPIIGGPLPLSSDAPTTTTPSTAKRQKNQAKNIPSSA